MRLVAALVCGLLATGRYSVANAHSFGSGHVLITVDGFLQEFARDGSIQYSIRVPWGADEPRPAREELADLDIGGDGRIYLINGSNTPYLSIFDAQSETWRHLTTPDWRTESFGSGTIAVFGTKVFADNSIPVPVGGLVAFDTESNTSRHLAIDARRVERGFDGLLYVNEDSNRYLVIDPETEQVLRDVQLSEPVTGTAFAVDVSGDFFVAEGLYFSRFDSAGTFINRHIVGADLIDIDVDPIGDLVLSGSTSSEGLVVLTDRWTFTSDLVHVGAVAPRSSIVPGSPEPSDAGLGDLAQPVDSEPAEAVSSDATGVADSGSRNDGDGEQPSAPLDLVSDSGCGCTSASSSPTPWAPSLILVLWFGRLRGRWRTTKLSTRKSTKGFN